MTQKIKARVKYSRNNELGFSTEPFDMTFDIVEDTPCINDSYSGSWDYEADIIEVLDECTMANPQWLYDYYNVVYKNDEGDTTEEFLAVPKSNFESERDINVVVEGIIKQVQWDKEVPDYYYGDCYSDDMKDMIKHMKRVRTLIELYELYDEFEDLMYAEADSFIEWQEELENEEI